MWLLYAILASFASPCAHFFTFFARLVHRYHILFCPFWKTSTVECGFRGSAEVFFSWNILSTRSYSLFFLSKRDRRMNACVDLFRRMF